VATHRTQAFTAKYNADVKRFLLPSITLFIIAACSSQPSPVSDPSQPSGRSPAIDPSIQGTDRDLLTQAMLFVPEKQRENFTLTTDDGRIISNKPQLLRGTTALTSEYVSGNTYKYTQTDQQFAVVNDRLRDPAGISPMAAPTCTLGSNTGPFYRSSSKPGPGGAAGLLNYWTAAKAQVILPSTIKVATNLSQNPTETPYVLLGGWGNNNDGLPVDAGLQGNYKKATNTWEWQLFLKVSSTTATTASNATLRFKNGQAVDLTFTVYRKSSTEINVQISASANGQTTAAQLSAPGWSTNGSQNIMKRLTGIAQASSNFTNGSKLTETIWQNLQIGGTSGTFPTVTAQYINWNNQGKLQCFNPNSTKVSLDAFSIWDYFEAISINLL
jgi:hypothetical protein